MTVYIGKILSKIMKIHTWKTEHFLLHYLEFIISKWMWFRYFTHLVASGSDIGMFLGNWVRIIALPQKNNIFKIKEIKKCGEQVSRGLNPQHGHFAYVYILCRSNHENFKNESQSIYWTSSHPKLTELHI